MRSPHRNRAARSLEEHRAQKERLNPAKRKYMNRHFFKRRLGSPSFFFPLIQVFPYSELLTSAIDAYNLRHYRFIPFILIHLMPRFTYIMF